MAYADVEDVEKRVGKTFGASMSTVIENFLEDFSDILNIKLEMYGIDPLTISPSLLKLEATLRGVGYYYGLQSMGGLQAISNTVGDVSESKTFSSKIKGLEDYFIPSDLFLRNIGVSKFFYSTLEFEYGD